MRSDLQNSIAEIKLRNFHHEWRIWLWVRSYIRLLPTQKTNLISSGCCFTHPEGLNVFTSDEQKHVYSSSALLMCKSRITHTTRGPSLDKCDIGPLALPVILPPESHNNQLHNIGLGPSQVRVEQAGLPQPFRSSSPSRKPSSWPMSQDLVSFGMSCF